MPSMRFRLQEALAERFRWVQFPRTEQNYRRFWGVEQSKLYVFLFGRPSDKPHEPFQFWKTPMRLWKRMFLASMYLLLMILALAVGAFVLSAIYAFLTALSS